MADEPREPDGSYRVKAARTGSPSRSTARMARAVMNVDLDARHQRMVEGRRKPAGPPLEQSTARAAERRAIFRAAPTDPVLATSRKRSSSKAKSGGKTKKTKKTSAARKRSR